MWAYILRRILQIVPVMFLVSVVVFLMLHLSPGDPALIILGDRVVDYTPEEIDEVRHDMGLDRPLAIQYGDWVLDTLRGDLGRSFYMRRDVRPIILERLQATALLASAALVFAIPVGVGAGILATLKRHTIWDRVIGMLVVTGIAMPVFAVGLFFVVIFGLKLDWLPTSGMTTFGDGSLVDRVRHIILPAVTLGFAPAAVLSRLTRSSMLEVLNEDYVRTARAKGLRERIVIVRHAFRNVLIPVVTVIGLQIGFLLGGAVLVEAVFAWPGMGQLVVFGILQRDFPIVQASVLVLAFTYVFINMLVDLSYAALDPRIRYE